jgi:polyhydroxybutyrate depolymerase
MRDLTGWDELAEREGVVVAYPEGLDRTWNAGA